MATNIVFSWTGSVNCSLLASSYTGVAQSGQPDAASTSTSAASTTFSKSLTTVADNCWIVWSVRHNAGDDQTAGTNTSEINSYDTFGHTYYDTNSAQTPAGSHTLAASSTSAGWGGAIMSFSPNGTIARDANASAQASPGTSITTALTVSGSNRFLTVGLMYDDGATSISGTFDGVSMTKGTNTASQGSTNAEIWYLVAPNLPVTAPTTRFKSLLGVGL